MKTLIILAIAVLAAYVAFQFFRASRSGDSLRLPPDAPERPPIEPVVDVRPGAEMARDEAGENEAEEAEEDEDEGTGEGDGDGLVYQRPSALPEPDVSAAPPVAQPFEFELELTRLRRELEQQRGEIAALRERLEATEAVLNAQQEHVEARLARQGVSPEYNEALLYAQRGLDVEVIAERCGITVAEAELVQSLARRQAGQGGAEGA